MRVLMVIPSVMKRGIEADVAADRHPTMDYTALADVLRGRGARVETLDYTSACGGALPRDVSLAWQAFRRKRDFDVVFTNGENVSLPLALLFKLSTRRPRHVTIGHRLSAVKKRPFFTVLKAHKQIDKIFLYATSQLLYALNELKIQHSKLSLIPFNADAKFFRPLAGVAVNDNLISAAGLEWRDYNVLIDAADRLPAMTFKLAAASPWSKHKNNTSKRELPANVYTRRYEYGELRELYATSAIVVVPLLENDFQAGVTSILEAMAMGKPVIVTKTEGQTDVIVEGETGIYVPPGDSAAMLDAIVRLTGDVDLRRKLGRAARTWLESNASLDKWAKSIADAIVGS